MAGLSILGGAGVDRAKRNLEGVIYILGDEFTDGSVRLIIGTNDQTHIEKRINGVWNPAEILLDIMTLSREADLTLDHEGNFVVGRTF